MQCITSDMTTFYFNGIYYELTLYMDLWNNEIICHLLSTKRGDKRTYISGLRQLLKLKRQYSSLKQYFIQIKVLYMHQRNLMIYYLAIILQDPCLELNPH